MELRLLTRIKARDYYDYVLYRVGRYFYIALGFITVMAGGAIVAEGKPVTSIGIYIVIMLLYFIQSVISAISHAKLQPVRETVINPDGIFSRNDKTESYWKYSDIRRVVERNKYFYIFLPYNEVFIIPKYQLGSNNNVVVLRNFFINNVSGRRLKLINNDGSFNDNRKLKFDINRELELARSDEENSSKYVNPFAVTIMIMVVLVGFSFFSDYLRTRAGLKEGDGDILSYEEDGDVDLETYINGSEKLLVVADEVLELTDMGKTVSPQVADIKGDEIAAAENMLWLYTESEELKELDRLNSALISRLYEVVGLRRSYNQSELEVHKAELARLKEDIVSLKKRCNDELYSVKENNKREK